MPIQYAYFYAFVASYVGRKIAVVSVTHLFSNDFSLHL